MIKLAVTKKGICYHCGKPAEQSGGDWHTLLVSPKGLLCWTCWSNGAILRKLGFKVETLMDQQC